jgi:hypothetical protein
MAARVFPGGLTVIPGSTFGGVIVPFFWDSRSLMLPSGGAIFSGGVVVAFGGATCTVGLAGDAGSGFCASAGAAARINAVSESVRSMVQSLSLRLLERDRAERHVQSA